MDAGMLLGAVDSIPAKISAVQTVFARLALTGPTY
jgi:hypothetical protein